MNSLIRTIVPARMAVRSLMVPARRMATQPPTNQSKEEGKNTKEESKDIEKNPKKYAAIQLLLFLASLFFPFFFYSFLLLFWTSSYLFYSTEPGSKHALSSEDFGDEASYQNFGNEKVQDANKAWRMSPIPLPSLSHPSPIPLPSLSHPSPIPLPSLSHPSPLSSINY